MKKRLGNIIPGPFFVPGNKNSSMLGGNEVSSRIMYVSSNSIKG